METPEIALREAAESPSPHTFRLYRMNDAVVEGRPIEVSGDSVMLRVNGDSTIVAFDDVRRAESRKTKATATVLLILGVVAAPFLLTGIGLVIACSGQGEKCLS